jgi:putative SOS response-associated peptidase YedK
MLTSSSTEVQKYFGIEASLQFEPNYNIAPSQKILVVRQTTANAKEKAGSI